MYSCPRLVEVPRGVQLPTVMYKMPLFNVISDIIHGDPSLPSTTTTTKSCPEACVLEARQEAVLRRLQTLKDQLDRLQCTRTTTAAAAGSVVATLGAAAVASPARGVSSDLLRQQESVLYRLCRLKEKLGQLTAERNDNMEAAGEHPLTLPERHQGVLEVISALRGEMRFLADLQKWMDEREEDGETLKTKNTEEVEEVEERHRFVLRKMEALREELNVITKMLRSALNVEDDRDLIALCGCVDMSPIAVNPPHPSTSSLHPSLHPANLSSDVGPTSKFASLFGLLPLPPLPSSSSSSSTFCKTEDAPGSPIQDLVVSASPSAPPLSLLVLRKALALAGSPVFSSSRVHSSVTQVSRELHEAFSDSPLGERSNHPLALSLQWTDAPATTLMINPLRQTKISGEANLVRYLSRLFPAASPFNYEATGTYASIAEVDELVDEAERELVVDDSKGRPATLRCVNARLARSPFLCGARCGMADVLVWSLLRQRGQVGSRASKGQQEDAVSRWMAKMDDLAAVDLDAITPAPKQENKHRPTKSDTNNKKTTTTTVAQEKQDGGTKQPSAHGEKQLGRKELEAYLKDLGIAYQVKEHQAVFTVEELMAQLGDIKGVVTKNLFLKDKKKKLYLLSTRHNAEVDLKSIAKQVGTKDLRFADETILLNTLGVRQGCVSALALANDAAARLVTFLMDRAALEPSVPWVHCHPMSNSASVGLSPKDLRKFLAAISHPVTLVTLE